MKVSETPNPSALKRALWMFRREFLAVGTFSFVVNVLMLVPTLYMLQVYDRVLVSQSELTLLAMSLLTLFLFVVMALAEWMRSRLLVNAGMRLDSQLSTRVFNASFEANLNPSGADASRSFSDLIQVRQFLTSNGILAFFDAPWTPIYLLVLYVFHPWLGALGLLFALIQAVVAAFGHRLAMVPVESASRASAQANQLLMGNIRNAEVMESMGMVRNLRQRWAGQHELSLSAGGEAQKVTQRLMAVSKFLRYSQQSLALGAGALLVIDGQLSMGAMIATNVLMTRALAPIDLLVGGWRQFLSTRMAFVRLDELLAAHPPRVASVHQAVCSGQVSLKGVTATATGREAPILSDVNLQVEPGTVTVVMGPSGSGKSTLARVLVGVWPQLSGEVLLDGRPLNGWDREELGPRLGYLPQDVELFDGSIAENIARFGELDAQQIIEAAQKSGLHEMILRLPKGYDTPIGEAGSMLSGGQRQRIALARAVYGNPTLLVLDEPNANLDDVGEAALYRTVQQLKAAGKTVFLISHRPSALAVADRILVLNNGKVEIEGPRDAVVAAFRAMSKPPANASSAPVSVSVSQPASGLPQVKPT